MAEVLRREQGALPKGGKEVIDRATFLPIGQYEDGSLTFAWPGFLKDAWEGGQRTFLDAGNVPVPDAAPGTRWSSDVDALNAASIAPMAGVAGRVAGAIPRGVLGSGGSDMVTKPKGITAYHGSPHDFDKFDLSKIGTGEGAQAYGHGLYFADNEAVARSYRDALSDGFALERPDGTRSAIPDNMRDVASDARDFGGDLSALADSYRKSLAELNPTNPWDRLSEPMLRRKLAAVEDWSANGAQPINPGRMYEVRINAEPEQFLDWDKPLSQQSEAVRDALSSLGFQEPSISWSTKSVTPPRGGAYTRHSATLGSGLEGRVVELPDGRFQATVTGADGGTQEFGSLAEAKSWAEAQGMHSIPHHLPLNSPDTAARLRDAGLPGIRYLDQGSRGAGEGSRNYVVFDDDLVEILRKYANPETAALPYLMQSGEDKPSMSSILRRQ
jgi:hypothetical protein